jgi:Flp pilus assembly protein TadG
MLVVELAIVLPFLLVLILGLMEYGWLFLKTQQITNAARQGARTGARADATTAEISTAVAAAMAAAGLDGSGYSLTLTPGDPSTLLAGELLTLEVSVSYTNIGLGVPLVPTPATLDSMVTMAREGPP